MNCPFPINGGIANNTNIVGLTVTYDLIRDNATEDYRLTLFDCQVTDPNTPLYAVSTTVLTTSNNWFNVGQSYLAYLMNVIFAVFAKLQAVFSILSFIITPANFTIIGYSLADISGVGLGFVILIYAICYMIIGVWLYVTFMPFKGSN